MKLPDLDRARSEKSLTFGQFMAAYNEELPASFPRVSAPLLKEFRKLHANLFKAGNRWSLDQHRKKVMDWLTSRSYVSAPELP
ncbi:hypothetical protein COU19_01055 [Candidatus Kaiserbacteria bacterium CG10_big_fil_rev_8_21_14_0_10_56_12]|uniref:Uncharacterized protein n=1 Tax=Candidatus Kaiserbacteria bacterium CG10_big_fil_rev_8_21_14_0_10_56_12 TaxID=1974611 RepID=A0A2H0UA96_9BACT|nr:MAG: hypothetical protein COU19_01055 [Candidatus Kaiserbacteria bacterium CG10_big_fil_rev_8_21_14_0_10_56_12]